MVKMLRRLCSTGDKPACRITALLLSTLIATAAAAATGPGRTSPAKPIRIVITTTPGSGGDVHARLLGSKLTGTLGQQIVVDNRAGASGIIGAEIAARAAPDALMMATSQHAVVTAMFEKLGKAIKAAGVRPDM